MSELAREALPIAVMFTFVLLLAPLVGFTMWAAFDGDRLRDPEDSAAGMRAEAANEAPVSTGVRVAARADAAEAALGCERGVSAA